MKIDENRPGKPKISDSIDIRKLEHESRRYLLIGFLVAVLFHGAVGLYMGFEPLRIRQETGRPIPVRLITISPPDSKPYEITQHKFRKKKLDKMSIDSEKPVSKIKTRKQALYDDHDSFETGELGIDGYEPGIVNPDANERFVPDGFGLEYDGIARIPDRHRAFRDEWVSLDDLDTGRYKALLIHDPNDKTNIKGYVHIPVGVWGTILHPPQDTMRYVIINLKEALYRYTGISMIIDRPIYLSSPEIFKYPFIYIVPGGVVELLRFEAENFRKYLDSGGFALCEPDIQPLNIRIPNKRKQKEQSLTRSDIPEEALRAYGFIKDEPVNDRVRPGNESNKAPSLKQMIKDTFGDDVALKEIPDDHEIFNTVFDLDIYGKLEGISRGRRLVLIYSEKAYGSQLLRYNTYSMKMCVNMVVYALSTGSIAQQMIDDSSNPVQNSRQWWDYRPDLNHD